MKAISEWEIINHGEAIELEVDGMRIPERYEAPEVGLDDYWHIVCTGQGRSVRSAAQVAFDSIEDFLAEFEIERVDLNEGIRELDGMVNIPTRRILNVSIRFKLTDDALAATGYPVGGV